MVYWYWYKALSWLYGNFTNEYSVDIYHYSNAQMKYLPENSVKKLLKTMLCSNKPVYLTKNVDRRSHNDDSDAKQTDPNLTYRLAQLKDYMFTEFL